MSSVFLVDDSAFVRKALARVLGAEAGFHVVGEARNGPEALERIPAADPDVVTLDVGMPGMSGLEVLRMLLRWKPRLKVIMLSVHTRHGAEATLEALDAGAIDFIDKSRFSIMDLDGFRREVVEKLKVWAPVSIRGPEDLGGGERIIDLPDAITAGVSELCVIGASTGGPRAIHQIIESLPASFPVPLVIVQHMPIGFTRAFAERLNSLTSLEVAEAVDCERLRPGQVVVARAGLHLRMTTTLGVVLTETPSEVKHIPSIDVTMKSAAHARPGRVLGILLTGMGNDGAEGMEAIRASGGYTIAQDEATCAVYGMPRAAQLRGAVDSLLPLSAIISFLEGLELRKRAEVRE